MGVYNSIWFSCPRCDAQLEAQSKADDGCANYSNHEVPPHIAYDIAKDHIWCERCGRGYRVVAEQVSTVQCYLIEKG